MKNWIKEIKENWKVILFTELLAVVVWLIFVQ